MSDSPLIDLSADPFTLFESWMKEAEAHEPNDPEAVALATTTQDGHPSVRMVLLKGADHRGFVVYTNTESRKGDELRANPRAALLFHWKSLRRQIRIEGPVVQVSDQEANAYFSSRSLKSRLGALASDQSRPLADRRLFEQRLRDVEAQYRQRPVPRPPHWTGFRIVPERIEFWQDRPHRLHDRAVWSKTPEHRRGETWTVTRLYP